MLIIVQTVLQNNVKIAMKCIKVCDFVTSIF